MGTYSFSTLIEFKAQIMIMKLLLGSVGKSVKQIKELFEDSLFGIKLINELSYTSLDIYGLLMVCVVRFATVKLNFHSNIDDVAIAYPYSQIEISALDSSKLLEENEKLIQILNEQLAIRNDVFSV